MRKKMVAIAFAMMLLAMSTSAVMAKPDTKSIVAGGATFDDPNFPQSISVSMYANERTQSGNLTHRGIIDQTLFSYGFTAEITCVVSGPGGTGNDVVLVAGTVTSGTDRDGNDATGKIIRRLVRDGSLDRVAGGFPADLSDLGNCFENDFAANPPAGFPIKNGNLVFIEAPR